MKYFEEKKQYKLFKKKKPKPTLVVFKPLRFGTNIIHNAFKNVPKYFFL